MKLTDEQIEKLKAFLTWAKMQGIKTVNLETGSFEFSEAFILTEQAAKAVDGQKDHNAPTSGAGTLDQKEFTDEEMLFWSAEPIRTPEEEN